MERHNIVKALSRDQAPEAVWGFLPLRSLREIGEVVRCVIDD